MRYSLLFALMLATPAHAGFEEFASAFPVFPCMDGWMACKVGATDVNPDLHNDSTGRPVTANSRIGFWDLEPTAAFSPFSTLSKYNGTMPPPVDDGVAVADDPVDVADDPDPVVLKDPVPKDPVIAKVDPVAKDPVIAKVDPVAKDPLVRPKDPVKADPGLADPVVKVEPITPVSIEPGPKNGSADPGIKPLGTDAAEVITKCEELTKLEPPAMLGKLADPAIACLEAKFAASDKMTDKDKISRLLMANAWSKGDKATWEKLIKRHLVEVDQSDPEIAYKYADQLARKGASRSLEAIKWADIALERRTVWTGDVYVKRTAALYKIRAMAAQTQWKAAEEAHSAAPTDETQKSADAWRGKTKTNAREWHGYLVAAGQDPTLALQLCLAAAGTEAFCKE